MSNLPFKIFSGTKSHYLAEKIAEKLGVTLGKMNIQHFADGEFEVSYEESVRGDEVYLIQSTFPNCDNLMELLLMIDAAKRASAKSVNAVIPYFGWARQDRKDKPRVSIAAKLVANMLTAAGVDSVTTMDLHADQIQGFFNLPVNHLYASSVFIPYIKKLKLKDLVIASPDVGGAKRANDYAKYFKAPLVLCHKQRARANVVEKITIIGDVKDKNVILVDDMIDTGGTICAAANIMKEAGAASVRALASHAIMSDPASERINNSALVEVMLSDSFPYDASRCSKVTIVSVAGLIADTIQRVHSHESISSQYLV
ncbi:MAG: ribose-phosphate pyrophosphokinase [Muribaculaceae bacterium]|nr:ribose-phosphate pyrophosphokinase [Muribaculaceae bacterium]